MGGSKKRATRGKSNWHRFLLADLKFYYESDNDKWIKTGDNDQLNLTVEYKNINEKWFDLLYASYLKDHAVFYEKKEIKYELIHFSEKK